MIFHKQKYPFLVIKLDPTEGLRDSYSDAFEIPPFTRFQFSNAEC